VHAEEAGEAPDAGADADAGDGPQRLCPPVQDRHPHDDDGVGPRRHRRHGPERGDGEQHREIGHVLSLKHQGKHLHRHPRSTSTAAAVGSAVEGGMVSIYHMGLRLLEAPFGGIKDSGIGCEGGTEGIGAYLSPKFVSQI